MGSFAGIYIYSIVLKKFYSFSIVLLDSITIISQDGHIDMLSSDHSPSPPELKLLNEGDFLKAWGGISSLQVHAR